MLSFVISFVRHRGTSAISCTDTRLLCLLLTPPVLSLPDMSLQSIEKMYHGLVARMLVINSPSAVKAMYRIVRPILPPSIQERV
jgi:hypothetical protein